jgi:mannobiose 2-epimerase
MDDLKNEMYNELLSILSYWESNMPDDINGGFIGAIDYTDTKDFLVEKGSVLNARILWAFSAAYPVTKNEAHLKIAERAFEYITNHFYDKVNSGIYWSVNADGTPKDTKNQIYALAFTIYGLSEFFSVTNNDDALQLAVNLYEVIEKYSYDPVNKGYFEAFTQNWKPIEDLRLSAKDVNEKKTMNTHLHIAEGYANLYRVWPNESLQKSLIQLLHTINDHFINSDTGHLRLFFNEEWIEKPDVISYGHDIEAAWLLQWCAEVTKDDALIAIYKREAITMTDATLEGIDANDGGLWYEYDPNENKMIAEKHWWPQSELLIGMINAWQLTGDQKYWDATQHNWEFIKDYIIDRQKGEWIWGVDNNYNGMRKDKAGFWKCPYHNSRACIELVKRLDS